MLVICTCSQMTANDENTSATDQMLFGVLDVGQGLSQAIVKDHEAVFWDMGDVDSYAQWHDAYTDALNSPAIKAIIISHGDLDHKGGLYYLPGSLSFSGRIITSPYEDTAALRVFCQEWSSQITFQTVARGDTLALFDGVSILCLWPPSIADSGQWVMDNFTVNRFSLCFKITYGNTSMLITSDIDTVAMQHIADKSTYTLQSNLVVVPHHGSAGSLCPLFYGYADPDLAIISCGENNSYGHPVDAVVKFLAFQLLLKIHDTRYDHHCIGRSNGIYWTW